MKNHLALILFFILAPTTQASVLFYSPNTASATNTNLAGTSPENLIDGSGLSSTPITLDNIGTISHSAGPNDTIWRGSTTTPPLPVVLTFGFNSAQTIQYVGFWQGIQLREGINAYTLTFFDGVNGTGNVIGSSFSGGLYFGNGSPNSISLLGTAVDVGERVNVRSFTMQIDSYAVPLNPHVHFGEVMVAVPEPSTTFLFLGTAGLLALRRRA